MQNYVNDLVRLFGCPEKRNGASSFDDYIELLQQNQSQVSALRIQDSSSDATFKNLLESSPYPEDFLQKYNELKFKNVCEVDSLIKLLSKVKCNDAVQLMLRKTLPKANGSGDAGNDICSLNLNARLLSKDSHKQAISTFATNWRSGASKRTVPPGIYALPNWIRERCHLSWDFITEDEGSNTSGPIGVLPTNVQESRLIDDVLFCLVGIDGDYIHSKKLVSINSSRHFSLDDSANISLKLLVQNIMPMFSHYSTIIRFVEAKFHFEEGLVNHALSASMRTFLKDYFVLVSQLENQHLQHNLTLQKLWFYLQPALTTMETISNIAMILTKKDCFGGNVLTVLHENSTSLIGSSTSREICHTLARAASRPYFEILEKWIYKGIISDYYSEFLVQDNVEILERLTIADDKWARCYTLREDQVPKFLQKASDMILQTGKYLNVIRQCGKSVECPNAKSIIYTMRESQYIEYIEPAYQFASKKLLDLLMDETDLKRRLVSVKHYFLLDQGDFIVQFMDMAEEELRKDADDVMFTRLVSLLELALRTSVVNEDKYKDDLMVDFRSEDLLTEICKLNLIAPSAQLASMNKRDPRNLTGLEAFAVTYEVKWPLTLILNVKSLAYYQFLFRHLFYCKHVENMLSRLWQLNKRTKKLPRSELCPYAPAFALRQRMLHFIQNLNYYLNFEVIEPRWQNFFKKIPQVTNIDDLIKNHDNFLQSCFEDCMLSDPKLHHVLGKLTKLCIEFSNYLQTVMKSCVKTDVSTMADSMTSSVNEHQSTGLSNSPAALENFKQAVNEFEENFNKGIIAMIDILHLVYTGTKGSKLINLLYRLDFSRFYDKMRE